MNQPPILTVSQLSQAIKHSLERTFPQICLQGEVSNFKPHTSGHFYFSLKDANAQIAAVMFRPQASLLKILPKEGMQVLVQGELNVYPVSGKYQLVVRELKPIGIGELLLKLEERKIKLHQMGWFRSDRKRPLPKFPRCIGVVTSPTGAVIQDMLNILTRRFTGFKLILNPVKVQGEGAAQEIAQAIEQFNRYDLVDVMIVGRGGGSIEDLWAFNEEIVASAIYHSRIPIISAVGHETDHCIADYVADVRAPTPSAAAELVIAEKATQLKHLKQLRQRIEHTLLQLVRQDRHRLQGLFRHPILQTPYGVIGPWIERASQLSEGIEGAMKQRLATQRLLLNAAHQQLLSLRPAARLMHHRQKLGEFDRDIKACIGRKLLAHRQALSRGASLLQSGWQMRQHHRRTMFKREIKVKQLDVLWERGHRYKKERLEHLSEALHAVNPKNLLKKGYCILFSEKEHCAITTVHSVVDHQSVQVLLSDGSLYATINEVIPDESSR